MSGPDVFISYNRDDAAVARLYADGLAEAGLSVWWDATLRSGEDYDAVTETSLRTAKAVVVLWSPRSVNSRWVRAEATIADRGHTLVPVMIEACERPVMFELKQTVELSHWRGDVRDKVWLDFVADLRRKVGQIDSDPAAVAAAPAMPQQPQAAPVSAGRSTVAVMPVGCRGNDGELEALAEDLTEDITRELAHNGHFRVIAAGSMAAWRGKSIDHKDLGRQLSARYLIESRLQRSGKDSRLTAQLIDGNSGNVLWSTRLVANAEDADLLADTLPVAAAAQFAEQIVQREQTRAMAKRAPFSAWDHILRSAACSLRADPDGTRLAVEEARFAVAAAPDIGLAHAMLASALAALPESQGLKPDAEQIREIQTLTRQAMRLDGNNPSVLMALAGAYKGLGEYEICLRMARRTVELWPSSPQSYLILGNSYRMLGRTAEAVDAYRKQDQLSPFDNSRNVALTNLGECLLLEGQAEAAEAALDRALMLDPEYPVALEWKAIVADQLGKERAALDVMRQIRSADAAVPLDQHVWQIERTEHLRDRAAAHVATLRRLWLTIAGPAAVPAAKPELVEATVSSREEPRPAPAEAAPAAALAGVPATAAAVAFGSGETLETDGDAAAEMSAIPLKAGETPAAKRTRGKSKGGDAGAPTRAETTGPAASDEYLIDPAVQPMAADAAWGQAANDDEEQAGSERRFALPRVAALAGALVVAGIGGAVWLSAGNRDKTSESVAAGPSAAFAGFSLVPAVETPTVAAPSPLSEAMTALISASRSARRPQAELAALEAGQQQLAALLGQSAAEPANAALAEQMNAVAAGLARQQGAALTSDADRWFKSQQHEAAAARRKLMPEGAASVDRALNKARGARADLATLVAVSERAPDAMKSLDAARAAVSAYSKLAALPVAPAIASARAAEAETGHRLTRSRAEIETARVEVGQISGQVAGLAAIQKPGLFASSAKRQSYKLRKDNAERSRALAAEADRIAAQSSAVNELGELRSNLTQMRGLKSQAAELLAASNAALKSGAETEKKDNAIAKQ